MNPGILAAIALMSSEMGTRSSGGPDPKKHRPCIYCGKEHTHNNAYCSAECCKGHREEKS